MNRSAESFRKQALALRAVLKAMKEGDDKPEDSSDAPEKPKDREDDDA